MADCAICLSTDGYDSEVSRYQGRDAMMYDCPVCGVFAISRNALDESLAPGNKKISKVHRAVLSHRNRLKGRPAHDLEILTTDQIAKLIEENPTLPTPAQQAMNAIRFIGERIQIDFLPISSLPPCFQAYIGAPTRRYALNLIRELSQRSHITFQDSKTRGNPYEVSQVDLTLEGWNEFEVERRGGFSSNLGFIALKFGDTILDPFVAEVLKPGLAKLGFQLVDLRDVSRAGIIDNLMRSQIRDAAFVIVDLTHDNSGAYWEAGYAEGLGKPVIYICEREKFNQNKTHFDTNHCTTVLWSLDDPDSFLMQLSATVRRSILY